MNMNVKQSTPRPYQPDMVPTPLSLLNNDDDEPNIPFDDRPCAKLLTALKDKHTRYSRQRTRCETSQ